MKIKPEFRLQGLTLPRSHLQVIGLRYIDNSHTELALELKKVRTDIILCALFIVIALVLLIFSKSLEKSGVKGLKLKGF